ncbi:MAG: 2-C-methyl-D-erythritol 2,4-cyclodiphosphate synthase [Planctomycetes bacterium]|nr:2-C-methyl-D-erythritol 2,4-cyclodiphosphate synthase [Planctomycetota bacterium]
MRVGHGYDLHRLVEGRRLVLGGVEITYEKGLSGHSDGDVVLHAVIDAMLGAAGLGDIGEQFPDSAPAYKDIDSCELLGQAGEKIEQAGFEVSNIDVTVIAQEPKLSAYKGQMSQRIAEVLGIEQGAVSVKAKTNEGVDAVGRGEAMACHAVVLLTK